MTSPVSPPSRPEYVEIARMQKKRSPDGAWREIRADAQTRDTAAKPWSKEMWGFEPTTFGSGGQADHRPHALADAGTAADAVPGSEEYHQPARTRSGEVRLATAAWLSCAHRAPLLTR